ETSHAEKAVYFFKESSCISFANMVLATVLISHFRYYDGCLERRTVDSCGNSTCLKTPQSGFLEEAEAVPAESNGPQRKSTYTYVAVYRFCVKNHSFRKSL